VTTSRLIRLAVAISLTAFVVWKADLSEAARAARSLDLWWAAAAILLVLLDRALNAYRWMALLCALTPGTRPGFGTVLRIFFVSTFVGTFLPSVGGDIYRAYSLAREDVRAAESASSVLMDRALGVLSMVLLVVAALLLVPKYARDLRVGLALGLSAAGCLAFALAIFSSRAAGLVKRMASALPWASARRIGAALADAVRRYSAHRAELLNVLAASIGVQVLRVVQAYCLGRGLGIDLPLVLYFVFIPLAMLVMQVPITVAGLGTGQVAFDALFGQAGVPSGQALTLSLLFIALGFVGNLPGAVLYAWGRPDAR
jgi:uncharacterized protein (TIRG00374 family)